MLSSIEKGPTSSRIVKRVSLIAKTTSFTSRCPAPVTLLQTIESGLSIPCLTNPSPWLLTILDVYLCTEGA